MLEHAFQIIIYQRVGEPGFFIKVVDVLNATIYIYIYISILTTDVKLSFSKGCGTRLEMHASTQKYNISLAREFQKQLCGLSRKNFVIDQGKYITWASKCK